MSAEYKYCPKCHIINSPSAERCECGHCFATDGAALSEAELNAIIKKKKGRRRMLSAVVYTFIIVFMLFAIKYGFKVVLIAFAAAAVLLVLICIAYRIKSHYDRKRLGN